jgi:hypothetical protein
MVALLRGTKLSGEQFAWPGLRKAIKNPLSEIIVNTLVYAESSFFPPLPKHLLETSPKDDTVKLTLTAGITIIVTSSIVITHVVCTTLLNNPRSSKYSPTTLSVPSLSLHTARICPQSTRFIRVVADVQRGSGRHAKYVRVQEIE